MTLEKDEVSAIVEALRKDGCEKLADSILNFARANLPEEVSFDDVGDDAPLISLEHF